MGGRSRVSEKIGDSKFLKAWAWPGEVEEFLKVRAKGFTIHVCNGSSQLGDLTIDKYMPADIVGDMYNLPFRTGIADTIICDPPWGIPRHVRHKLVFELRRTLRLGGSLLFNAPWIPRIPGLELKEIWVSESIYPNNDCGVISVSQKTKESMFGDR